MTRIAATSATTHIAIANWAARSRSMNTESGSDSSPQKTVASTIAMYGFWPWWTNHTVPYAPRPR